MVDWTGLSGRCRSVRAIVMGKSSSSRPMINALSVVAESIGRAHYASLHCRREFEIRCRLAIRKDSRACAGTMTGEWKP